MNRACFPKKTHQNSQKWAKFMNFSFWPFLWFGLPGRLLIDIAFEQMRRSAFTLSDARRLAHAMLAAGHLPMLLLLILLAMLGETLFAPSWLLRY